ACYDAKINCDRWPLNISAVRRAFHYAINKTAICEMQGLRPHDSYLISPFPLSIESEMTHHYYDAEVEVGNAILDSIGFLDSDSDGWREGPGGVEIPPINIEFLRGAEDGPLQEDAANFLVDAFQNLSIEAYSTRYWDGFNPALIKAENMDFDIFLIAMAGFDLTLDSLIEAFSNDWYGWTNSTFDEYADIAAHSTNYTEVTAAMKQMQYIFIEEAPQLMLQQLPLFSAYRTDKFDGIIEHPTYGPHSFFTGLNVNGTSDTLLFGDTNHILYNHEVVSLPYYTCGIDVATWWSVKSHMEMLHDSLARLDPNLDVINWLAEEVSIETHEDDDTIPEGNTRFIIDLVQNARWNDGESITAHDVVYSINWFRDIYDGIPSDDYPTELYRCVAVSDSRLEIQFSTESYWHWYKICFLPILPRHAPNQYDPLRAYQLTPDEFTENLVVSGPFMASEWVLGEYIEIVQNPYYWRNPPENTTPPSTTTPPPDFTMTFVTGIVGAVTVAVVGGYWILKRE
ncbi:MAG: ABC transporter substrate-binding protein, partial [Candidatus Thorarchaeota archaeon]